MVVLAVCLNIWVVLPVRHVAIKQAGDTAYYLRNPSAITAQAFEAYLEGAGVDALAKELYKLQVIRNIKAARGTLANLAASAAIIVAVTYIVCTYFLPALDLHAQDILDASKNFLSLVFIPNRH